MAPDLEAIDVVGLAHRLEPAGHALGIAVLAAGANLAAASDRIPRGFGPLDGRLGHPERLPRWRKTEICVNRLFTIQQLTSHSCENRLSCQSPGFLSAIE